jgi:solute carrier family 25 carnitine/acylcarnitine transporter 20/29
LRQRLDWLRILVCTMLPPDLSPPVLVRRLFTYATHSFWSYEYCKRLMASENDNPHETALKVLLCGGIAGVTTWASVYPLDMIKTRLQAQTIATAPESRPLIHLQSNPHILNSYQIAKAAYRSEGLKAFYRGLGICSLRAFIVNAVQVCVLNSVIIMKWHLLIMRNSGQHTNGS